MNETNSKELDYRIYVNEHYSSSKIDYDDWVLANMNLKNELKVLDLGCGTGKHLFKIAELIGDKGLVIGYDINEESLQKCRDKINDKNIKNIKLCCGDLVKIKENLSNYRFDRILSSFAIYYTTNEEKTFNDIFDVMNNNSELFICGSSKTSNNEFISLIRKVTNEEFITWTNFIEDTAMNRMISLFGNVKKTMFQNRIIIPNKETLYNYWKSTAKYKPSLSGSIKKAILTEFSNKKEFAITKDIIGLKSIKHEGKQ